VVVEGRGKYHAGHMEDQCHSKQWWSKRTQRDTVPGDQMSRSEKAAIDRFEGEWAVLLLGTAGRVLNVRRDILPRRAREGQWLQVEFEDDEVVSARLDFEETRRVRQRIEAKLDKLRRGEHRK
jgi:hypothetical protein